MPLAKIEREGLKALLVSKVPLAYFMQSLIDFYSPELLCAFRKIYNLTTLVDIDSFENSNFSSEAEKKMCAQKIFVTYFDTRSYLEVNVDMKTKKSILQGIEGNSDDLHNCFKNAKAAILDLLEGSYQMFLKSEPFLNLLENTRKSNLFSIESRKLACAALKAYIPAKVDCSDPFFERKQYLR